VDDVMQVDLLGAWAVVAQAQVVEEPLAQGCHENLREEKQPPTVVAKEGDLITERLPWRKCKIYKTGEEEEGKSVQSLRGSSRGSLYLHRGAV
jgi:hypothetical protein